jgi:hypothetical protein
MRAACFVEHFQEEERAKGLARPFSSRIVNEEAARRKGPAAEIRAPPTMNTGLVSIQITNWKQFSRPH